MKFQASLQVHLWIYGLSIDPRSFPANSVHPEQIPRSPRRRLMARRIKVEFSVKEEFENPTKPKSHLKTRIQRNSKNRKEGSLLTERMPPMRVMSTT